MSVFKGIDLKRFFLVILIVLMAYTLFFALTAWCSTYLNLLLSYGIGVSMALLGLSIIIRYYHQHQLVSVFACHRFLLRSMMPGLLACCLLIIVLVFFKLTGHHADLLVIDQLFLQQPLFNLLSISLLIMPLFEEVLFRGYLFFGLSQARLSLEMNAIVTSLFWALLHIYYHASQMIVVFIIGVIFAYQRVKSESVWPCVILHSVFNLANLLLAFA